MTGQNKIKRLEDKYYQNKIYGSAYAFLSLVMKDFDGGEGVSGESAL
jgi:hypothetical protein